MASIIHVINSGADAVSGGGELSHTFEPGKFEVRDMRHLVVRQGERSDEIVPPADVDAIIVIAGSGKQGRGRPRHGVLG